MAHPLNSHTIERLDEQQRSLMRALGYEVPDPIPLDLSGTDARLDEFELLFQRASGTSDAADDAPTHTQPQDTAE